MRHQSSKASQKEENKARDQNPTEPLRGPECGSTPGRREGSPEQDTILDLRIRQQHRLSESLPQVCGLRCSLLHL